MNIIRIVLFLAMTPLALTPLAYAQTAKPVTALRVSSENLQLKSSLQAEVLPMASARLVSRVTGYVGKILVHEGQEVEQGAVLAQLDCPDLQAALQMATAAKTQAESQVQVAQSRQQAAAAEVAVADALIQKQKSQLQIAQVAMQLAQANHRRMQQLHEERATTDEELEGAEMMLAKGQAQLQAQEAETHAAGARQKQAAAAMQVCVAEQEQAKAGVQEAIAAAKAAQVNVSFASITCPYPKARITRQLLDPGTLALANQTAILEVMDMQRVRIRIPVPEVDANLVQPGTVLRIIRPHADIAATITRTTGAVDMETRTMAAEVELDNAGQDWIPGSLCKVELVTAQITDALMVPSLALVRMGADHYLWLAKDGKALQQKVRLGRDQGSRLQILEGLQVDDLVIFKGFARLRDGDPVKVEEVGG